jgi:hypothetical protein
MMRQPHQLTDQVSAEGSQRLVAKHNVTLQYEQQHDLQPTGRIACILKHHSVSTTSSTLPAVPVLA